MEEQLPESMEELKSLNIAKQMKAAELLGELAAKPVNNAVKKVNKMLKKYGLSVTVTMNFHELPKPE
jgi:D-alanyl-D-alanine carboxypeptidase